MSRGYVALIAMIPAPAPADSRNKGVILPSPPLSWDLRAMYLHNNIAEIDHHRIEEVTIERQASLSWKTRLFNRLTKQCHSISV